MLQVVSVSLLAASMTVVSSNIPGQTLASIMVLLIKERQAQMKDLGGQGGWW